MPFGLLNIGVQSLQSNTSALSVVGQNIANVNTDGYSRQRAELASREGLGGVQVLDVSRIADQFLSRQIWSDSASYNSASAFQTFANELDNLLASDVSSVSTSMDDYFGALQTVVDDPTSLPNRELLLSQSDALVKRFNDLDSNLERQNETLNGQLDSATKQVNALASNIAEINDKLRIATAAGSDANELLDKRDAALQSLSELINFTTSEHGDSGELDVFLGNGSPLVIGSNANQLKMTLDDSDVSRMNVSLQIGSQVSDISSQISGGKIGGMLEYRENVLDTARDRLGVIALTFADTMNQQHQKGMDLDGELGGRLFSDINGGSAPTDRLLANTNNSSSATGTVTIEDTGSLKASDYRLVFNGADSFTLIRNSDGKTWTDSDFSTQTTAGDVNNNNEIYQNNGVLTLQVDGFKLSLDSHGAFASGDQFSIRPARTAASDISLELKDPRQLALASPVKVEADAGNLGTGVASVEVTDIDATSFSSASGQLTPPVSIEFSEDSSGRSIYTVYDISDPNNPTVLDLGSGPLQDQPFVPGQPIELNGYSVTINNRPVAGDSFTVDYNTDGVSDNRNALAMSDLQYAKVVDDSSYQDQYGRLVERVGTDASVAKTNAQASKSVLDSNVQARSSLSGVNLDEEAAKLVQFQQAYQASAQLIRASQTVFDALIQAV